MVRDRGPRFPMSSRGLSILTLHSPPAPQVMRTTRQRVIVDLIDAPERASSQEPQKVPPRRRTPSPASHAAVRLARIAPARLTARAHPDLSPRGPPRTYYDLAERWAGTPPSQREARSLPRPPAAPASLRTPVEATGRRPSSSLPTGSVRRPNPPASTLLHQYLLWSTAIEPLHEARRRWKCHGDRSKRASPLLSSWRRLPQTPSRPGSRLYGVPHTHTRPYRSYSARIDRHPAWSLIL